MTQQPKKALVLAGTNSGVGKTTISIGLLAALRRRGVSVQPFKIGPDFLDPLHHEAACGRTSINLDGWMLDQQQVLDTFHRNMADCDLALLEGVMGLYDGRDGQTDAGSTAQIAKWLNAPVVLVVDCAAIARSAAALVKGFREFDPDLRLQGVVLNKVGGAAHTAWLHEAIGPANPNMALLGGIPKDAQLQVPERHLGLHMPHDLQHDYVDQLADVMEAHVDIDALLQVAATADVPPCVDAEGLQVPRQLPPTARVRIAVASGPAFCFYYQENLTLLRHFGADMCPFDPLADERLPDGVAGVYLGGGYPELHAAALSANLGMRAALRAFAAEGGVVYAECGGLMYLSQSLQVDAPHGPAYDMVGVFPFATVMNPDKMHMGYVEVTTLPGCPLFPPGTTARGQVFHFSEIVPPPPTPPKDRPYEATYQARPQIPGVDPIDEGYATRNVLASYVHLHFGSAPAFAESLVQQCQRVDLLRAHQAAALAARAAALQLRGSPLRGAPSSASLASVASLPSLPPPLRPCGNCGAHNVHETDTQSDSLRSCSGGDSDAAGVPDGTARGTAAAVASRRARRSSEHVLMLPPQPPPRSVSPPCTRQAPQHLAVAPTNPPPLYVPGMAHVASWHGPIATSGSSGALASAHALEDASTLPPPAGVLRSDTAPETSLHAYATSVLGVVIPSTVVAGGALSADPSKAAALAPFRHRDDVLVSMCPSATEMAFALGLGGRVAAVTDLCNAPREARSRLRSCRAALGQGAGDPMQHVHDDVDARAKALKRKGVSPFVVDVDVLAALQPRVVLVGGHPKACGPDIAHVAQAMQEAGLSPAYTQLLTIAPRTLADVLTCLEELGATAGVPSEAATLTRRLRHRLRAVAAATATAGGRPRTLVLTAVQPLTAGGGWVPELIQLAGGVDALQQPGAAPTRVTWEAVRASAPDVLVLAPCCTGAVGVGGGPPGLAEVSELASLPGWWSLPAVKHGNVFFVDHALVGRPGPRLVQGVEALGRMLHPEVALPRCPDKAVHKLALSGGQRCRPRLLPNYFLPFV